MSESLYFIAVVPPLEIQQEITVLKKEVAEKFGSTHALNSPPHITLQMPFKWKEKKFGQLYAAIENIQKQITPFEIELKNFDFFEPRVVFVAVVKNPTLDDLQKKVSTICRQQLHVLNSNYKDQGFCPHVTIGFRDLKKPMFYKAYEYFKNRNLHFHFEVARIELLKHDGKKWEVVDMN